MANRYWVGGSGTWDNTTTHWSASSGGAGGASVPTQSDDVIFDANSFSADGQTVTLEYVGDFPVCKTMNWSAIGYAVNLTGGVLKNVYVYEGAITLSSSLTITNDVNIYLGSNRAGSFSGASYSINFDGAVISDANFQMYPSIKSGATVNLTSDLDIGQGYFRGSGTGIFNTNSNNMYFGGFEISSDTDGSLTVNLGTSYIEANVNTGRGVLFGDFTGVTSLAIILNGQSSSFYLNSIGTNAPLNLTLSSGGLGYLEVDGGNTQLHSFNNTFNADELYVNSAVPKVTFKSSDTFIFNTVTASGSFGSLIQFRSDNPGVVANLSATTVDFSYLDVKDNVGVGGVPFYDYDGLDSGHNSNWIFPGVINSIVPSSGTRLGGTQVVLTGTNFIAGDTTITVDQVTIPAVDVTVNVAGTQAIFLAPPHPIGPANVYATTSLGDSNIVVYTYLPSDYDFIQNVFLVGASEGGSVLTLNTGKADVLTPIYYELETQELEFEARHHVKTITDKILVASKDAGDSKLQIRENDGDYKDIKIDMSKRISKSEVVNLKGNYFTAKWFGNSDDKSPMLEGIHAENIIDKGIENV